MKVHLLALVCVYLADCTHSTASSSKKIPLSVRRQLGPYRLFTPENAQVPAQFRRPVANNDSGPLKYRGMFELYDQDENNVKRIAPFGRYKAYNEEVLPNSQGKKMLEIKNRGDKGVDVTVKTRDAVITNHLDVPAKYVILDRDDGNDIVIKIVDVEGEKTEYRW